VQPPPPQHLPPTVRPQLGPPHRLPPCRGNGLDRIPIGKLFRVTGSGFPTTHPAPTPQPPGYDAHDPLLSLPPPHPTPPHRQLPVAPCPPPQLHCAPRRSCWSTGVGPLQWLGIMGMFRFFPHGTPSLPPPLPTPLTSPDPLHSPPPSRIDALLCSLPCCADWGGRGGLGGTVRVVLGV
jgi:hypothetical protein